ncbi:nuclease-related domain-containing protein [Sporosarcina jiandibaonis]|uniref:nuclease-related domain-containing protein n=1 Tax=Sporosarcina jiandibaonis TaxID=2715535 RepID=UPI001553BF46|nr:nuclease-related domain-containing protein [Sporosarcina jiandibaonis]
MQRLLPRLSEKHPQNKAISEKLYQVKAGYSGEVDVDRILPEIGLPQDVIILKGLTLEILPNFFAQLDTLILTRKRIILLEIKKYAGTVIFDVDSGKTIKISPNGEIEKFDCILHQLDRAAHGIKSWLKKLQINIPIEPILVMANQRTIIQEIPKPFTVKYGKQLPKYIRELPNIPDSLTQQQITNLANQFKSSQIHWKRIPACELYNIPPSDLEIGILCLECNTKMKRIPGRTWNCESCGKISSVAIGQAVADWFLLINPTLTNKQLRYFLELKSNTAASKIFKQLYLNRTGKPPRTIYTWNYKMPLYKQKLKK